MPSPGGAAQPHPGGARDHCGRLVEFPCGRGARGAGSAGAATAAQLGHAEQLVAGEVPWAKLLGGSGGGWRWGWLMGLEGLEVLGLGMVDGWLGVGGMSPGDGLMVGVGDGNGCSN